MNTNIPHCSDDAHSKGHEAPLSARMLPVACQASIEKWAECMLTPKDVSSQRRKTSAGKQPSTIWENYGFNDLTTK